MVFMMKDIQSCTKNKTMPENELSDELQSRCFKLTAITVQVVKSD
jgi:hypothetical protein